MRTMSDCQPPPGVSNVSEPVQRLEAYVAPRQGQISERISNALRIPLHAPPCLLARAATARHDDRLMIIGANYS